MDGVEKPDELFNAELLKVAGVDQDPDLGLHLLPDPAKARVELLGDILLL